MSLATQESSEMKVNRLERYWTKPEMDLVPAAEPGRRRLSEPQTGAASWIENIGEMLGDHPQATVIVALSVGVILGWLVKRR
jgi:ElaB/YqjD/DUF883 family membrane-anchored ribosome-binding protein